MRIALNRTSVVYLTAKSVAFIRSLKTKPSDTAEATPKHHSAMNHNQPGILRRVEGDASTLGVSLNSRLNSQLNARPDSPALVLVIVMLVVMAHLAPEYPITHRRISDDDRQNHRCAR